MTILLLSVLATFGHELNLEEGFDSWFGFMPAEFDFEHAREAGAYWDRPFFELFSWGMIEPEHLPPEEEGGPGFSDLSALVDSSGNLTPVFYAHRTIALKLGDFKKVEKIRERVRGKTILEGQYRFLKDNRVIYVLWSRRKLPSEIEGKVKVTDISGSEKILTSDSIRLTNSPIFVEKIETSPSSK